MRTACSHAVPKSVSRCLGGMREVNSTVAEEQSKLQAPRNTSHVVCTYIELNAEPTRSPSEMG